MKKTLQKRLLLEKTTVANLDANELQKLFGGDTNPRHSCEYPASGCPLIPDCAIHVRPTQGMTCGKPETV